MDINNPYYLFPVTIIWMIIMGLIQWYSQKYFIKKGSSKRRAVTISTMLAAFIGIIILSLALQLPTIVVAILIPIVVPGSTIYANALLSARNKIQQNKNR